MKQFNDKIAEQLQQGVIERVGEADFEVGELIFATWCGDQGREIYV